MPFAPLFALFPEISAAETRTAHTPEGAFTFVESFCDEPDCDCRRAYFLVYSDKDRSTPLATLTWGWEQPAFYKKWSSFPLSAEDIEELTGPALARMNRQSPLAPRMLELLRFLLRDENYRQRIVRHYLMFRDKVESGRSKTDASTKPSWRPPPVATAAPNEPCPCGSGRKYKKCCWQKQLQGNNP